MARRRVCGLALVAALAAGTPARADQIVYTADFSSPVGAEWSNTSTTTSPSGQPFLGTFGNGIVTLSLSGLDPHTSATVSFDAYIIGPWDGKHPTQGPDKFGFAADGTPLLLSTFSNVTQPVRRQDYPDPLGSGNNLPGTGAAATNSLGYSTDSTYHFSFTFNHASGSLALDFGAAGLSTGELWGIDNVTVSINAEGGGIAETPEPGGLLLALAGAAGLAGWRRWRPAQP